MLPEGKHGMMEVSWISLRTTTIFIITILQIQGGLHAMLFKAEKLSYMQLTQFILTDSSDQHQNQSSYWFGRSEL